MNIIFISNVITPHQTPLCEELVALPDVSFRFIESRDIDKGKLPIGWRDCGNHDYVISYKTITQNKDIVIQEILEADAVIFGSGDFGLIKKRLAANKLTFIYSERIYKNWREQLKYPYHLLKFNKLYGHSKELYLLCASAFAAKDYNSLGLFRNKAYKWGYFPRLEKFVERSSLDVSTKGKVHILWCARFLLLKHPELAIKLALKLKNNGYEFHLDMIGDGDQYHSIKHLIEKYQLFDVVTLLGSQPNDEVYRQMRTHDIFLFTSDKNEGWGAVSNESMSNGCVLVGSNMIGSVPYLIADGENGMIFKSEDVNSLYEKVTFLLSNPEILSNMSKKGVETINNLWSPQNAAKSLCILINDLLNHNDTSINEGPCSKD